MAATRQARQDAASAIFCQPIPAGWDDWTIASRHSYLIRLSQDFFLAALSLGPIAKLDAHQLATAREAARAVNINARQLALADVNDRARKEALETIGRMLDARAPARDLIDQTASETPEIPDAAQQIEQVEPAEQRGKPARRI